MPSLNLDENFLSSSEGMRIAKLAMMGRNDGKYNPSVEAAAK